MSDHPELQQQQHPHLPAPPFSFLPLDPTGPPGNAWSRFGPTDNLGMLNLLTPAVVKRAAQEIKIGRRVSLDWPLNKPLYPSFGRAGFQHELINRSEAINRLRSKSKKEGEEPGEEEEEEEEEEGFWCVNDDWVGFNTQGSSQWDGFRHFGNLKENRYFNGVSHEQLTSSSILGIDAWASSGGITSRGILLDYATWASKNNIPISAFSQQTIPLTHLQSIIREQNITFRPGDILFIRSGFAAAFNALLQDSSAKNSSAEEDSSSAGAAAAQEALARRPSPDFIGVESSEAMLEFLWENQFAAVAGDAPAFERSPPDILGVGDDDDDEEGETETGTEKETDTNKKSITLHGWLLAGWGMPIGELFDLEELAATCRELDRWEFFVCSVPLKIPGGVASPPNAVAIF